MVLAKKELSLKSNILAKKLIVMLSLIIIDFAK